MVIETSPQGLIIYCLQIGGNDRRTRSLQAPWSPSALGARGNPPVYGGSGAVGSFAIKLAARSNIHQIIVVAGRGEKYVASLLDGSKDDATVDYRKGDEAVV